MAATSVTGVGFGSSKGSEHMYLGVEKLIGPMWHKDKERVEQEIKSLQEATECTRNDYNNLKCVVGLLVVLQVLVGVAFGALLLVR